MLKSTYVTLLDAPDSPDAPDREFIPKNNLLTHGEGVEEIEEIESPCVGCSLISCCCCLESCLWLSFLKPF